MSARRIGDMERGVPRMPRKDTLALLAAALTLSPQESSALAAAARHLAPGARPAPAHTSTSALPVVGRTQELALLERHLAGQPGIGKSRLLQEAVRRAGDQGWRVLAGGCTRSGGQQPFTPLLQALQGHLAERSSAERRLDLRGCAWLIRLLPELPEGEIEPLPRFAPSPEQERRLMFEAVRRLLGNVADPAGTLLLLDDLQWAGADALDLLVSLLRQAPGPQLRAVGAYRDTDVAPDHPLAGTLADLAEAQLATLQPLRPLAHGEAAELFAQLRGGRERAEPAVAARLVQRTGGVPFFLVSYARSLEDEGGDDPARPGLPWDLRQSIQRRVLALPEAGRALVAAAAVIGRVTPLPLLLAVLARPEPEVLDALDNACRAGLLEEVGDDAYGFVHDVIREVAEGDLGRARRAMLHRRTAEALEGRTRAVPAEVLAYHYGRSDMPERVVGYLELAGDQARAQHGRAAAEGFYREAVERLDRLGRPLDAARVREQLGTLLYTGSRYGEALAALEPAAEAHRAAGDLEATGRVVAEIAMVYIDGGTAAEGLARLEPVLALLAERGPSRALAALYTVQSPLLDLQGRFREALAAAEQAERIARLVGDDQQLADALYIRGLALLDLGRSGEAARALSSAIPVAEAAGAPWSLCWALTWLGEAHREQGSFAAGREVAERARQLAERHGFRSAVAASTMQRGWIAFLTGEWIAARRDFERALAFGRELGPFWGSAYLLLGPGRLCLAEGAEAEASLHLEECEQLLRSGGHIHARLPAASALAERDLLAGHPAAARTRLAPLVDQGAIEENTTLALPLMAWALLDLGEVDEAAEVAWQAVARARDTGRQVLLVDAQRVAAMVWARQGHLEEAEGALAEGLSLAQRLGYPYGEARLLQVYGELQARTGRSAPGRERLEAALALFRRLGARNDLERAEQLLTALG